MINNGVPVQNGGRVKNKSFTYKYVTAKSSALT